MTRTRTLRRGLALAGVVAAVVAVGVAAPSGIPGGTPAAAAVVGDCTPATDWGTLRQDLATQVVQLVNQHRAALGLAQLTTTTPLTNAAVWKSRHMAYYRYLQHADPAPPVARSVGDRLLACGYPSTSAGWGENIAYGYATASAVMQGWLNSPGHRANIENPSYRAIGVGAAASSGGTLFWTQAFGTSTTGGSTPAPAPAPTPAPAPAPEVTATASSATLNAGTYLSGGISSLAADDESHLRLAASNGWVLWWGRITGVPKTVTKLAVGYRGSASSPCTQTLWLYNWTTGAWMSLGSRTLDAVETETVAIATGTLAEYVSGTTGNGDVAVRVGCSGGAFTSSSEQLKVTYLP